MKIWLRVICGLFVLITFIVALRQPISIIILIGALCIAIKISSSFSESATIVLILVVCVGFGLYLNSVSPLFNQKIEASGFNHSYLTVTKKDESSINREVINVPSDKNAKYYLLDKNKNGSLTDITIERHGSSGVTFSKRSYSCHTNEVMYVGTGDTLDDMKNSKPDKGMSKIVPDSIAYYIGLAACN